MAKRGRSYYTKGRPKKRGRYAAAKMVKRKRPNYRYRNIRTAGFLSIERKFYDTFLSAGVLPAPSDCTGGEMDPSATSMISTPAVGDGEQNRDGKQIVCLYLEIKGTITYSAVEAATAPPSVAKAFIACVLDKQTNAAQMNSEDCFKNTGADGAVAVMPIRNLLFGKRFKILKEKLFTMHPNITQQAANDFSSQRVDQNFAWFIPLKNLKINFKNGTTADIANVLDNSIHVIGFASLASPVVNLSYQARLRFMG